MRQGDKTTPLGRPLFSTLPTARAGVSRGYNLESVGTELFYWLQLNGTSDKRKILLEAICKIFSNGAVAYGREII